MDGQSITVLAIVAVAAAIVFRRMFSLTRGVSGCGMGCSNCAQATNHPGSALVQLGVPTQTLSRGIDGHSCGSHCLTGSARKDLVVDGNNCKHSVNDTADHKACASP